MSEERNDVHLLIEENGAWLLTFFGIIGGCLSGMTIYFLKSRCSKIKVCYGLIDCEREVIPADQINVNNA